MAHFEEDVNWGQNHQVKDPLQLFDDVKIYLAELVSSRSVFFGFRTGPHITLHDIGCSQGGFQHREDGTIVRFELRKIESRNETLVMEALREDTRRKYVYRLNDGSDCLDISNGEYRLPKDSRDLAIADLRSLSNHLGYLVLAATNHKVYA